MLKPKTPSRDSTTHLRISALEFMPLPIESPLCGGQIRWIYVSSGSFTPIRIEALAGGAPAYS